MKTNFRTPHLLFSLLLFVLSLVSHEVKSQDETNPGEPSVYYFGGVINGVTAGYGKTAISDVIYNKRKMILLEENVVIKQSVLGGNVDVDIKQKYYIDPKTGSFVFYESDIKQGNLEMGTVIEIKGDIAYYFSKLDNTRKEIPLDNDILLENSHFFPHLVIDFSNSQNEKKRYKVLDVLKGEIQEKDYTFEGNELIEAEGKEYSTIVLTEMNVKTGVSRKLWLDPELKFPIKMIIANRVTLVLSDKSIMKQITSVNLNEVLFAKVDKLIGDIHGINYMKVKANIRSAGEWLTPEGLNVPGQGFEGTVVDNLIDGVFTIEHKKYDGSRAPPYPYDYNFKEEFKKYLEPEDYIESEDPVMVNKALEIVDGSTDSWEAVKRLSKWVSEEIKGAVPGGITARKTFDTRSGECGGHSRLMTALCRGAGIPARVVTGCMYSSYYGGSFGQHAWNEVYMGEAGWIPLDATAFEVDFVDCGHIRLGELTSFNPVKMEILDYQVNGVKMTEETKIPAAILAKFENYIGNYTMLRNNNVFKVSVVGENLAVDIPKQMVLVLNDPNEEGEWYAKIAPTVYFTFKKEEDNYVSGMQLHQITPFLRNAEPDSVGEDVPDDLIPYLAKYHLPQANATFEVSYKEGRLSVFDPFNKRDVSINPPDERGRWHDDSNTYTFEFDKDKEGKVVALKIFVEYFLPKGEPAGPIIKEAILTHGIEAGKSQYNELKKAPKGKIVLIESTLNALGYELYTEGHKEEAIEVLKWNVEAYPESWNVYDSLGEAYMKNGQKDLAIQNYKKSLELNPENDNGKKMLEEIEK
ncbi:MAG: transglutaminase domain-containing protein [Bacteroidales bacterium]|nr:transglutaminase domain-containing protein [Bacteroidales bacterium]